MPLPAQLRIDLNRVRVATEHISSVWCSARYTRGACRLSRRVSANQRAVGGPCRQLRRRLAEQRRDLLGRPRDRLTGVAALHRRRDGTFSSTPITVSTTWPFEEFAPALGRG